MKARRGELTAGFLHFSIKPQCKGFFQATSLKATLPSLPKNKFQVTFIE